jgi:hypothetical protein
MQPLHRLRADYSRQPDLTLSTPYFEWEMLFVSADLA